MLSRVEAVKRKVIMKLEYVPRRLSRKDTVLVVRELKAIESDLGLITPKEVVRRAKGTKSPLHPFFEWDDSKAAGKYREVQARQLICAVYVRNAEKEDAENVRAFVNIKAESVSDGGPQLQGYISAGTMLANPSLQEQVLAYARNQLVGWRLRFGHLEAFLGIAREIDKVIPPKQEKAA